MEGTLAQARDPAIDAANRRGADLAIETELLDGRPATAIADHAGETNADAFYADHRGLSAERENAVRSDAKGIIDEAAVPVTVTR